MIGDREEFSFPYHLSLFTCHLFKNYASADAEVVVHAAVGINRVVIDLNQAQVDFFVEFYVQAAAERTGYSGIGKSCVAGKGNDSAGTISRYADWSFEGAAIHGNAAHCKSERFKTGFRGVVLKLNAAEKLVNRAFIFKGKSAVYAERGKHYRAVVIRARNCSANAEIARNIARVRAFKTVKRRAVSAADLPVRIADVKFVFVVVVVRCAGVRLSENGDAQND